MTPNDAIAGGYRMAKLLLHRMVDDLTPAEFGHQPVPGTNSPAWVVGHLAQTLRRTAGRMGAAGLPPLPAGPADRFNATKQPAGGRPTSATRPNCCGCSMSTRTRSETANYRTKKPGTLAGARLPDILTGPVHPFGSLAA